MCRMMCSQAESEGGEVEENVAADILTKLETFYLPAYAGDLHGGRPVRNVLSVAIRAARGAVTVVSRSFTEHVAVVVVVGNCLERSETVGGC